MINSNKLSLLLTQKEGPTLEFKKRYNMNGQGKGQIYDEIAKDIVSLANSNAKREHGSAYLIIGADDKQSADGTREKENVSGLYSEEKFLKIVNERVTPPIANIEYYEKETNNNIYGIIEIPFSPYLHQISRDLDTPGGIWRKGSTIIRHKDIIGVATPDEFKQIQATKAYRQIHGVIAVLYIIVTVLVSIVFVTVIAKSKRTEEAIPKLSPVKIISSRDGLSSKKRKQTSLIFQSKILNPNRVPVDITRVNITAHIPPYQEFGCGEPPPEFFEISDQITISERRDGKDYNITANYKDRNSGDSTAFRANGKAIVDGCMGEGSLSLSLDTMLKVQANEAIVITFKIPEKFKITKAGIWAPDDPQKRAAYIKEITEEGYHIDDKVDLEMIKNGATARLNKWKFCFLMTDGTSTCSNEI